MRKDTKRSLSLKTHTLRQLTAAELGMVVGGGELTICNSCVASGGANCSYQQTQDEASCPNGGGDVLC